MPIKPCTKDGKKGWKIGDDGACITGPGARAKVERMYAAYRAKTHSGGKKK